MYDRHALGRDPPGVDETIAASLVDGHVDADLREIDRRFHPQREGMADVDRRRRGKPDEGLPARDRVMSVNDIGRLGELLQVVDDADAAGGDLLGRRSESGRIDDGPVSPSQKPEREVAHDGFRSGAMGEPYIREQNDQSVGHPRQLVSVAVPPCCMGKLSVGAT